MYWGQRVRRISNSNYVTRLVVELTQIDQENFKNAASNDPDLIFSFEEVEFWNVFDKIDDVLRR